MTIEEATDKRRNPESKIRVGRAGRRHEQIYLGRAKASEVYCTSAKVDELNSKGELKSGKI